MFRIKRNLRLFYNTLRPDCKPPGRAAVPLVAVEALEQYIERYPWVFQDEMSQFLWEECGIELDRFNVARLSKRRRFSRKKTRRVAKRQSLLLRALWQAETVDLRPSQRVFIDESAFNERTSLRLLPNRPPCSLS